MTTVKTSIGSDSSITTATPSSCSGSSSPYTVSFSSAPSGVSVGDSVSFTDESTSYSTYTFLITGISGSDLTLKFLTDSGGWGDTSPCSIYNSSYSQAAGTFKRTYSTITAWEADLDNSTIYSSGDDAVGECYKDSNFNERFTINGGATVGLSSIRLTSPAGQRHDGTAGSGVVNVYNSGQQSTSIIARNNVTIEFMEYHMGSNTINNRALSVTSAGYENVIFRNNIIHNLTGSFPQAIRFDGGNSSSDTRYVLNNIIYDINDSDDRVKAVVHIGNYPVYFWNNTTYLIRTGRSDKDAYSFYSNASSAVMELKNNLGIMTASTGSEAFADNYTSGSDYNGSDFSTATGGSNDLTSLTTSQFVSVTSGAEDLHLADGASAIGAGVDLGTTAGVNVDIDGETRSGSWSMSADQGPAQDVTITPDAAALTLTATNPAVDKSLTPAAASLALTATDPTVVKGSVVITPPAATLTLTGESPTVVRGSVVISPSAAPLNLTADDPTLAKGSLTLTPAAASIVLTASASVPVNISPDPASITFTADNPTVVRGSVTRTPSAAALSLTASDPTVVKSSVTITPPPATLTLSADDPTAVKGSMSLTPTPAAIVYTASDPTTGEAVTPAAAVISYTASVGDIVKSSVTITPAAAEITFSALVGSIHTTGIVDFSTPLLTPPSITSASIKPPTITTPRLKPNEATGNLERG